MSYRPSIILRNGHVQSIYPSLFRKVSAFPSTRERISTDDDDFLDLDWFIDNNKRLVILSHGLEGNSRRPYVLGMAQQAIQNGWDALAWNYRGCSGEQNNFAASYHSGKTEDLSLVTEHALTHGYKEIALIGFSIGGNKTLLHLGREYAHIPKEVMAAVALSAPCDLKSSSAHLAKFSHKIYMANFLKSFKEKLQDKQKIFPNEIDTINFHKIKNFKQFDERYTAPLNGFLSAEDYWQKSSSIGYLKNINVPTMILNALDDPFLPDECYPIEQAKNNDFIHLEIPKYGGHIGFMPDERNKPFYSEQRAMAFINKFSQKNKKTIS